MWLDEGTTGVEVGGGDFSAGQKRIRFRMRLILEAAPANRQLAPLRNRIPENYGTIAPD